MELIKQVQNKISKRLEEDASDKERWIYNCLVGGATKLPLSKDSSQIDKVCHAAFHQMTVRKDLVIQIQNTQPFKNMHYSNNFIEVLAMAHHDFEFEKKHLTQIIENGTNKEIFIIKKLFPEWKDVSYNNSFSPLDKLIDYVFVQEKFENVSDYVIDAFSEPLDLLDLFVLECAIKKAWGLHPDREIEDELKVLIRLHNNLEKRIKSRLKKFFGFLLAITAFAVVSLIFWVNITFWDNWGLEPILTAASFSTSIMTIFCAIFIRKKVPNAREWFDNFIEDRAKQRYLSIGSIKRRLDEIRTKHIEKDNPIG